MSYTNPFCLELSRQSSSGHAWFWGYAFVFLGFSLHLPANFAVALASLVFLASPREIMPYLYFFSLPWMYVAKFDFGLTLSLVQSVIYVGRVLLARQPIRFSPFEFVVLLSLVGAGFLGFQRTGLTTEISFVFYFFIACQMRYAYFSDPATRRVFLRNMLFAIMVSDGIAMIYGWVNGTSHLRHIAGLGYSSQLFGTMGTTRFAMYLCLALLYPLYCVEDKKLKFVLAGLLSAAVIATISQSSLVILGIVWAVYLATTSGKTKTFLGVALGVLLVGMGGPLIWGWISRIPLFSPMAARVELTIDNLQAGDWDKATTGRASLFDAYRDEYANADLPDKLFGQHVVKLEDLKHSHNSYLDMLNCMGLTGLVLLLLLQIKRIRDNFKYPERHLLLSLKIIILLPAMSVSIFSAQFWQVFLYF